MRRLLIVVASLLCAAAVASAQGWTRGADGGSACSSLDTGSCVYDFSDTTDSNTLGIHSKCLPVTVSFDPDEDGSNTGAEVQLYGCSESTLSTNHCYKILADTDGDGVVNDVTLDGSTLMRRGIDGVTTGLLAVDVTANPGSDDARVVVTCGRN